MTTTTETEITMRRIGGRSYPAANVKVRRYVGDVIRDARNGEGNLDLGSDADEFLNWLEAEMDTGDCWEKFGVWEEAAAEDGFDDAQEYLRDAFDRPTLKVYSDGRSGGWLYTMDLGSEETWEWIEAGPSEPADFAQKWADFEKWAEQRAQDCADEAVTLIYLSVWEPFRDEHPDRTPEFTPARRIPAGWV